MNLTLYSDPHLGLSRKAHTTPASAKSWRHKIFSTALEISTNNDQAICLGDLFDSYSNSEEDIAQGYFLTTSAEVVLAGNHDVSNRADSVSSLQLLNDILLGSANRPLIACADYGKYRVYRRIYGQSRFTFIPHVATKELFEQALQEAERRANEKKDQFQVLCLHCNYDLSESFAKANTTLNLTQERAYALLSSFHRILIGHEHVARQDPQTDRIQLLGNIFPTSFSDISDKYYWSYDCDTDELTPHLCWSMNEGFYKGAASGAKDGYEFYDIDDDLPPGKAAKVVTKLYASPTTLAVRLNRKDRDVKSETSAEVCDFTALPALIEAELAKTSPELLSLFQEYMRNVAED